MKFEVLDVVTRVGKSGKEFSQAACRGEGQKGAFLFVAMCPNDIERGQICDMTVKFDQSGNYILPY